MEEIDENFLPDLYDFEESLMNNPNQDKTNPCKVNSAVELEIADSMDTIVNNADSRSAMALD